jgi:transposase
MESTAQYWKPVWGTLEQYWKPKREKREGAGKMCGTLHLCQAKSNHGPRGRKNDFADGERMVKRLVANELVLSFVPDPEQRLWRTVTRRKVQLTRIKVGFRNQLESLLEQAHIKLSSFVSDLLGVSARRMLKALADGATDPAALAAMADCRLRATPEELRDALGACTQLNPVFRRLLKMALEELELVEKHIEKLEKEAMDLMQEHQDAIQRVAEVPGFGLDSAMQMIAEVGPKAAAFQVAKALSSWVGVCPGSNESAGEMHSTRSPKGNHHMRRLLDQAAQSAVKVKGSIFELTFHRLLPRLGYKQAIWAIAHRLCRLLWLILHQGVRYEERGPAVSAKSKRTRAARMIRELRNLGYRIEGGPVPAGKQA